MNVYVLANGPRGVDAFYAVVGSRVEEDAALDRDLLLRGVDLVVPVQDELALAVLDGCNVT